MLRYLTNKRKNTRREKNHDAVKDIYRRGASTVPAERLITHQEASLETKTRVLAAAEDRRQRRLAKRIAQ